MPKRKLEEAIIVNPNEPLHKCYDCIHWHRNDEKKETRGGGLLVGLMRQQRVLQMPSFVYLQRMGKRKRDNLRQYS